MRTGALREIQVRREGAMNINMDTYVREMQVRLDKLKAQIDGLRARAGEVSADLTAEYNRKLREIDGLQGDLNGTLQKIKVAGGDAWKDLKTGADHALSELEKAVSNSISRFR
jgi:hypothetical protein